MSGGGIIAVQTATTRQQRELDPKQEEKNLRTLDRMCKVVKQEGWVAPSLVGTVASQPARTARESLDLVFHMSNLLETGLDRHTLSILIALCDLGLNPESLATLVKELHSQPSSSVSSPAATPSFP